MRLWSERGSWSADWTVSYRDDVLLPQELDEFGLRIAWIDLNLVNNGPDLGIGQDVTNELSVEV